MRMERRKNPARSAWLCTSVLTALLLALPAGAAAQEGRGAEIVVTKTDRSQYRGELIAVRPGSLLLLRPDGRDMTVGLEEIGTLRIVRRSPTGLLTLAGFLLGSWAVGMTTEPLDEWGWAHATLAGIGGAIAGLASGLTLAKDRTFYSGGAPDHRLDGYLDKLGQLSRQGRSREGARPGRRARVRLGLATTMGSFDTSWRSRITDASWRFAEDVPPAEDLTYVTAFVLNQSRAQEMASLGPLAVGYDWTERWTSEIELSLFGRVQDANMIMAPQFISSSDGTRYGADLSGRFQVGYGSICVGAAYRPVVPSSGRKASVELGVAAGPAWIKVAPAEPLLPAAKKTVLAFQVRAAYDHHFTPSLSLGVYGGYRHSEAHFPGASVTQELTFTDWENWQDPAEPIVRRVELNVPSRTFSRSGLLYGLRLAVRI